MSQAQIGNLNVSLGINTAQFAAGIAQAQGSLAKFGASLKSFAGMAAGALSLGAIGVAVKSSIDRMDELGKAAQKIGIPVEELSKLEYAGKLADVSLDALASTMTRFSKNLSEVAGGGKNDAGAALRAMGIAATDAQGKLRPTTDILKDVADEMSVMKDGAGKTALAIALFGKSGADLIPLLNGGREAIAQAGAEAKAFGTVVSEEAAVAAERFNDNLTRLGEAANGVTQQVAVGMLPAMNNVTDAMVEFAAKGEIVKQVTDTMSWLMTEAAKGAIFLSQAFTEVAEMATFLGDAMSRISNGDFSGIADDWAASQGRVKAALEANIEAMKRLNEEEQRSTAWLKGDLPSDKRTKEAPIIPDLAATKKAADEAAKALEKLKAEGQSIWEGTRTPLESYQLGIRNLNDLLQQGAIDHDTYDRAVKQLQEDFSASVPAANEFGEALQSIGETIVNTLGSAIDGLISGTMSLKDAFKSMVSSVAQQLSQLAAQLIKSSIFKLLSMLAGGMGGFTAGGMSFGGFYADGGNLGSGKWGIAGEAGPEIVKGPASITPLSKASAPAPQMNVTVINNSSASVSTRQGANGGLEVMVEEMIADKLLRGGNKIDSALARGYGLRRAGR